MQPALPVQAISPARICEASTVEPDRFDRGDRELDVLVAHARDQQVLPDRQADIAVAEILRDLRKPAHLLAGDLAERQRDADPVQALLLLLVHADMRHAVERRTRRHRFRRHAGEGVAELLLDERKELLHAHGVDHVFHPRLEAVGAVAGVDEDADDGVRHLGRVRRLDDDVGVFGKILVAGDAAEAQAKPDAGLDAETVLHLDRGKRDVVGVFQHRDLAGAVEGDVELARQAGQRAVVEDVVVPLAGIFAGVEQFLRIDARPSACP